MTTRHLSSIVGTLLWLGFTSCSPKNSCGEIEAAAVPMAIDSIPNIHNLQDMQLINGYLYITYDYKGGYGQQLLRRYKADINTRTLTYDNGFTKLLDFSHHFFAPVLFCDNKDQLFVYERDNTSLYTISEDSIHRTGMILISPKADIPYEMVLQARQAFYVRDSEYYFIGRQPLSGIQGVFLSSNRGDSLTVKEAARLVFNAEYPSWVVNYGYFTYNHTADRGVYAYLMFPALQFLDFRENTIRTIAEKKNTFDPKTISEADVWELNPVQYKHISSTDKHVYALYWGITYSEMAGQRSQNLAKSKIMQYNWNGDLTRIIHVNKGIEAFAVSADDRSVIGFDGQNFFLIDTNPQAME